MLANIVDSRQITIPKYQTPVVFAKQRLNQHQPNYGALCRNLQGTDCEKDVITHDLSTCTSTKLKACLSIYYLNTHQGVNSLDKMYVYIDSCTKLESNQNHTTIF